MLRIPRFFSAVALSCFGLAACGDHHDTTTTTPPDDTDTESQAIATDGTDASATEGDGVSLTGTLVSESSTGLGLASEDPGAGDLTLDNVGAGARLFFAPVGCLTTANPMADSVTYTFSDCTGPRGLFHITGEVDVTYATSNGTLTLNLTTKGLQVNRATVDWTVSASITASGANRTMHWSGHLDGTTRGGKAFSRDNDKTLTWTVGGTCFEINGTSEGTVGARDLKTELISYQRCKAACPEPESEIKITNVTLGKTVDLTYGDGNATFTNAKGSEVTFVPACASTP